MDCGSGFDQTRIGSKLKPPLPDENRRAMVLQCRGSALCCVQEKLEGVMPSGKEMIRTRGYAPRANAPPPPAPHLLKIAGTAETAVVALSVPTNLRRCRKSLSVPINMMSPYAVPPIGESCNSFCSHRSVNLRCLQRPLLPLRSLPPETSAMSLTGEEATVEPPPKSVRCHQFCRHRMGTTTRNLPPDCPREVCNIHATLGGHSISICSWTPLQRPFHLLLLEEQLRHWQKPMH